MLYLHQLKFAGTSHSFVEVLVVNEVGTCTSPLLNAKFGACSLDGLNTLVDHVT